MVPRAHICSCDSCREKKKKSTKRNCCNCSGETPIPRSSAPSATHAVRHKIDRAFLLQGKWACERKKLNAQHQEHQRAFPPPCGSINAQTVKRPRPSAIPWVKGAEAFRNRAKCGERKPILAPQVLPRPSSGLLLLTPPPNE